MLPVSASELTSIQREVVSAVCDKSAILYHRTGTTKGASGEPKPTYDAGTTTVAGMTEPTANELANYDYLIGDKLAWKIRLPVSITAYPQDHIEIDGRLLEVHVQLSPRSYEILHAVIAAEIA